MTSPTSQAIVQLWRNDHGAAKVPALIAGAGTVFGLGAFFLQDEGVNAVLGLSAKPRRYPLAGACEKFRRAYCLSPYVKCSSETFRSFAPSMTFQPDGKWA